MKYEGYTQTELVAALLPSALFEKIKNVDWTYYYPCSTTELELKHILFITSKIHLKMMQKCRENSEDTYFYYLLKCKDVKDWKGTRVIG